MTDRYSGLWRLLIVLACTAGTAFAARSDDCGELEAMTLTEAQEHNEWLDAEESGLVVRLDPIGWQREDGAWVYPAALCVETQEENP